MRRFVVLFLVPFLSVFLLACDNNCPDDCGDGFYSAISESSKSVVLVDETVDVSADGHKAYKLDAQRGYCFRIDIASASDVSVWVMPEDEYSHFKKGESFNYVSSASREKVMRFSYDLKDVYGSYYLVLDDGLHYQSPCWTELRVSMLERSEESSFD
jgi:hypothetical protein